MFKEIENLASLLDAVLDQNAWGQVGWVYCCKSDSGKRKRSGIKIGEELRGERGRIKDSS
ncbi:hypothetical protein BJY00DRAFT_272203 [Aspergillus carlsbadensis]|nr:hypothetical protein BJY00DRAFT_272203 [Aspergillus carlsbadensis]